MGFSWKLRWLAVMTCLFAAVFWGSEKGWAQTAEVDLDEVIYSSADSVEVVQLLRADCGLEDVLFYARHFVGRPYVGHTLEKDPRELLVVNLRQLDCTTLVETVCALALTKRQRSDNFADFCKNLARLRYWNGVRDGYGSRLHYFSWWIKDNVRRGVVKEISEPELFYRSMLVRNNYMSLHPEFYRFLKDNAKNRAVIKSRETDNNGDTFYYMDEDMTGMDRQRLSFIHNGDIVAIVTTKKGLDYSHLGFAVWGDDGRLHLLNASSVYKKVVEDQHTLKNYLGGIRSSVGVRLLRLAENEAF